MHDTYTESYEILGLRPGDGLKELKTAYRRRVRASHPDRFPRDDQRKKRADDETKAINKAYKELADYYRRHGTMPWQTREHVTPGTHRRPARGRYESTPGPNSAVQSRARFEDLLREGFPRWRLVLFGLMAILISIAYVILSAVPSRNGGAKVAHTAPSIPHGTSAETREQPAPHRDEPFFTIGSTLGEVYSVQGVPSKTENDVWHYGNSRIYFSNGIVIKWESTSEHPLNARSDRRPDRTPLLFTRGSTKSDVRQIQGTPMRESDKVWDYGISRIYFEGDRVVDWYESPLNPLQIKR